MLESGFFGSSVGLSFKSGSPETCDFGSAISALSNGVSAFVLLGGWLPDNLEITLRDVSNPNLSFSMHINRHVSQHILLPLLMRDSEVF